MRGERDESKHLPLVTWLSFGDKLQVLKAAGVERLLDRCRSQSSTQEALLNDLREVQELRNDVAHDKPGLREHRAMCRRLRLAHELAHCLARSDGKSP
jgi:hypothetical protein